MALDDAAVALNDAALNDAAASGAASTAAVPMLGIKRKFFLCHALAWPNVETYPSHSPCKVWCYKCRSPAFKPKGSTDSMVAHDD